MSYPYLPEIAIFGPLLHWSSTSEDWNGPLYRFWWGKQKSPSCSHM